MFVYPYRQPDKDDILTPHMQMWRGVGDRHPPPQATYREAGHGPYPPTVQVGRASRARHPIACARGATDNGTRRFGVGQGERMPV